MNPVWMIFLRRLRWVGLLFGCPLSAELEVGLEDGITRLIEQIPRVCMYIQTRYKMRLEWCPRQGAFLRVVRGGLESFCLLALDAPMIQNPGKVDRE